MENDDPKKSDNLSKLARDLEEIEGRNGGVTDPARANEVREGLVTAMRGVYQSHYEFAERLDRYHALFKEKKTATAAMERIAKEYGCSSRTLYRLLSNYDNAKQLPLVFVDTMREEGIDPVLGKHQSLVTILTTAPEPASGEEAKASLKTARAKVLKMVPAGRKARTAPASHATQTTQTTDTNETIDSAGASGETAETAPTDATDQTTQGEIEEFTTRIVRMFEEHFGSYLGEDRDEQIRAVLERVVKALHADVHELHTDDRPNRVGKPAKKTP